MKMTSEAAIAPEAASESIPDEVIGGTPRMMDVTLKAGEKMNSILETLEKDCSKPEAMESLLGVLSQIIKGKFKIWSNESLFMYPFTDDTELKRNIVSPK
jgi:hypothetical protein